MLRSRVMQVPLVAAPCGALTARWTGGRATSQRARLTVRAAFAGIAPEGEPSTRTGVGAGATEGRMTIAPRELAPAAAAAVDARIIRGDLAGSLTVRPAVARR